MGQAVSGLWRQLFGSGDYKIVMVGLDNAGKTTTLYHLHMGETVKTQPTIGSNVEQVKVDALNFEVWDLGGQVSLRLSWAAYYASTDAVIVVIDSTDRARMGIARQELANILASPQLAGACILVFANKQDLPEAMSVQELSETLDLVSIKDHNWHVQASCAVSGEGLKEGLQWIARHIKAQNTSIFPSLPSLT
ncbi:hypothetical protein ACKKBF_B09030 [Auxenochlorella protothecoides x Auxenochlorella symbiontica]|uniref:ADP-ribosylation factor-like protein 5 n=1 Tax=Auxenochlorella protothecoides TaxID=3075 RepID=A0A1D2A8K2_AUXPR